MLGDIRREQRISVSVGELLSSVPIGAGRRMVRLLEGLKDMALQLFSKRHDKALKRQHQAYRDCPVWQNDPRVTALTKNLSKDEWTLPSVGWTDKEDENGDDEVDTDLGKRRCNEGEGCVICFPERGC